MFLSSTLFAVPVVTDPGGAGFSKYFTIHKRPNISAPPAVAATFGTAGPREVGFQSRLEF